MDVRSDFVMPQYNRPDFERPVFVQDFITKLAAGLGLDF